MLKSQEDSYCKKVQSQPGEYFEKVIGELEAKQKTLQGNIVNEEWEQQLKKEAEAVLRAGKNHRTGPSSILKWFNRGCALYGMSAKSDPGPNKRSGLMMLHKSACLNNQNLLDLASIKLEEKPQLQIDKEAKEYLQLEEPRKKIGQTIISLLEKKQIKKQL